MKTMQEFTGLYPLSKTLRFELKPIGKTQENIEQKGIVSADEIRADRYKEMKTTIDKFHKWFIEKALKNVTLSNLNEYFEMYNASAEAKNDKKHKESFSKIKDALRKEIVNGYKSGEAKDIFAKLFKKELIQDELEKWINGQEEIDIKFYEDFKKFTTYFNGFNKNRENIYSDKEKSTAIAYRLIHENLPKFIDNMKTFEKIKNTEIYQELPTVYKNMEAYLNVLSIDDMFALSYFNETLTQTQIDAYNAVIGGKTLGDGAKLLGINEQINLYNQKQDDKKLKISKLKVLYKQILSDKMSISFLPDAFESVNEMLNSIIKYYGDNLVNYLDDQSQKIINVFDEILVLVKELSQYDTSKIFLRNDTQMSSISQKIFSNYSVIGEALNLYYESVTVPDFKAKYVAAKENSRETLDKEKQQFNKTVSIEYLQKAVDLYIKTLDDSVDNKDILQGYHKSCIANYFINFFYAEKTDENGKKFDFISNITAKYSCIKGLLNTEFDEQGQLTQMDKDNIKLFLDAIMELFHFVKPLFLKADEVSQKDERFYSAFNPLYEQLSYVSKLYDKVRNFVTKKPYSTKKVKINFENGSLLSGWAQDYDTKGGLIIRKDNNFYLAIVEKKLSQLEKETLKNSADIDLAQRIIYDYQKPDNKNIPRLFIRSKGTQYAPAIEKYNLPINTIIEIYDQEKFKTKYKNVNPEEFKVSLIKLIDYFKEGFKKHESYKHYVFNWKDSHEYNDISEFYHDVESSCYQLLIENINYRTLLDFVDEGKIYLFQIYNKDFSEYCKGKPNLHTMYWKALFAEENLKNVVYKLSGGAEIFFRKASIASENIITHKANLPIDSKNPETIGKTNIFDYDLVKDKRYTTDKYQFHVPITLNFKASEQTFINNKVREYLKNNPDVNIIGIDRGERHLIYISLIDQKGNIIKDKNDKYIQYSLNTITGEYKDNAGAIKPFETPYHTLLDNREKDREKARENWGAIENIKELKEGYISQVVYKITKLMVEHNAIVVMEDLNFGFKNGRFKVEKQVYQKLEKMLIDKLNYLVFKDKSDNEVGGLYKALQLANKFESFKDLGKQSGFIFYVPAWNTSKIDPVTGFVDFLKPKYTSVNEAISFFSKFDSIFYNREKDYFEFQFDYNNFGTKAEGTRTKWSVCTQGKERFVYDKKLNQNRGGYHKWDVTALIKDLLTNNDVEFSMGQDVKDEIINHDNAAFLSKILKYLQVTLAMRYSSADAKRDFILSPVADENGVFFNSENKIPTLPEDADANGAYNIARKGLWALMQINSADDISKTKLAISNKQWLNFVQEKMYLGD